MRDLVCKKFLLIPQKLENHGSSSQGATSLGPLLREPACQIPLTWLQGERTSQWPQRRSWQDWVILGRGRCAQRSGGTDEPPPPNSCRQRSWRCWDPGPQERLQDVHSPVSQLRAWAGWGRDSDTNGQNRCAGCHVQTEAQPGGGDPSEGRGHPEHLESGLPGGVQAARVFMLSMECQPF